MVIAAITDLRSQGISTQTLGDVLLAARDGGLLGDRFRARTSEDPNCNLLYLLPLESANGVQVVWLDFEPFRSAPPIQVGEGYVPAPARGETTVTWVIGESAAEAAAELEQSLNRLNRPRGGFSLAFALEQVARSVEIAQAARSAADGSPLRLQGKLELLINDEWVLTDFGLESVRTADAFQIQAAGARTITRSGSIWDMALVLPDGVTHGPALDEALAWLRDREQVQIEYV